jgi:hypothetical protein
MITGLTASRYYEIQLNMFTTGGDGPWSHPKVVHTEAGTILHKDWKRLSMIS